MLIKEKKGKGKKERKKNSLCSRQERRRYHTLYMHRRRIVRIAVCVRPIVAGDPPIFGDGAPRVCDKCARVASASMKMRTVAITRDSRKSRYPAKRADSADKRDAIHGRSSGSRSASRANGFIPPSDFFFLLRATIERGLNPAQ